MEQNKDLKLDIRGFTETSFLDWDGHVVSTIYLPLCNFRCPFCHNALLVEGFEELERIPCANIIDFLKGKEKFIDGVCLTGGEPCLHKNNGLVEFLKVIKDMGFKVKLDTNGYLPSVIECLLKEKLVDYIAMDMKGPLDERYYKLSGIKTDLSKIKKSIDIIMKSGLDYEFRTTVVPTLLEGKDILDMAKSIKGAKKFVLQQFAPKNCWSDDLKKVKPYSKEILEKIRETSLSFVKECIIRGV